jgi:hypothetical protein
MLEGDFAVADRTYRAVLPDITGVSYARGRTWFAAQASVT